MLVLVSWESADRGTEGMVLNSKGYWLMLRLLL